jgi:hypothetical protein
MYGIIDYLSNCILVILLKVEFTVGDELETFYEINYKNDEILIFTLSWVFSESHYRWLCNSIN